MHIRRIKRHLRLVRPAIVLDNKDVASEHCRRCKAVNCRRSLIRSGFVIGYFTTLQDHQCPKRKESEIRHLKYSFVISGCIIMPAHVCCATKHTTLLPFQNIQPLYNGGETASTTITVNHRQSMHREDKGALAF